MEKAKQLAFFYLKFRSRTVHEMRQYLQRKKEKFHFSDEEIDATIEYLKGLNYLDDRKYIEDYVRIKTGAKPQGIKKLRFDLKKRGIHDDLLNSFFNEATVDEDTAAQEALERKWHRFTDLTPHERFQKAAQFLAGRGFSYTVIKKTIAYFENNEVK